MILVVLDLMALNLLLLLSQVLFLHRITSVNWNAYILYWSIANAGWLLVAFLLRTYVEKVILNFENFTKRTIQVYLVWILFILVYLFFSREFVISRFFIVISTTTFGLGLMVNRFIYLGISKYFKSKDYLSKKIIILGYNDTAKKLAKYIESEGLNNQMIGFIEDNKNIDELSHYPILADICDTLQVAKQLDAQEIFSTLTPEQNSSIYNLIYQLEKECIRFKIVPNLSVFINREVHIEYFGDLPILSLRNEPLEDVGNKLKKRILDIIVSSFVIIFILSWLIPLVGLLIFIESGWPIFFKQLRTGENLKPFYCWKFRSMGLNKDANEKQATQNDSRVTRVGKILRKTSLDEFPQFINVFKGEMSLVGPRPHMLKHTNDYSKVVDEYMVRQLLKPGITGWAQIHGYRGEITNAEQIQGRINKDLWYLENWSLFLDIRILFLTVYYIFRKDDKAY